MTAGLPTMVWVMTAAAPLAVWWVAADLRPGGGRDRRRQRWSERLGVTIVMRGQHWEAPGARVGTAFLVAVIDCVTLIVRALLPVALLSGVAWAVA